MKGWSQVPSALCWEYGNRMSRGKVGSGTSFGTM